MAWADCQKVKARGAEKPQRPPGRKDFSDDEATKDFCQFAQAKFGCVYGAFTGGAAVLAANAVKKVKGAEWLDLGTPEALWIFEVEDFGPLTVGIDSHGNNLFKDVADAAEKNRAKAYEIIGVKE